MVTNRIIFFATSVQPNPEEIDYWVDLSDNPYGGSIKYFNGTEWVRLAASGGVPDLNNYYTKTQVNKLLNDKANIGDVDSKVDDEEVKDVIKDIQFNTSNPNGITMVMFKYDGSNKTVSIPVASTSSAGIITSKDFLDFVKQHQLQELHTEMIDTFADIRAKYQKKLIAGLNIEIDQETNVISASGDLAVQWDNITGKPDFKPVATSGDYNDLINKLKPGKDVSISEDNTISIAIDSDSLEQSLATLQSNIDKEAATARAAETKLGNDIATEKNRAQSAEQTISTNLQNVMIKIPEFWYVDDYTPGTKTHNLKICPHAKPGWYHHKEAYVSAYEAFNFDNKGRLVSMRSVVPTVNFNRTNGRTWARANGFDGEAKWNLYTYEEHRAICHLFLVEYATRNSQKAVNTALTPEGFRQGGLGSGCTTGTATINGAQTWSFILTGSSDSLGSGSGEVTVTIQQTDSSGHNTSTITRKCNRYRGIENPFGHIWKYTDDIISKYEAPYRTWYKSVKPDQFATNKNNSYKPLCSVDNVNVGYKTEIKATPACDFFSMSVSGGSETTYWCDYNWDNTDTSEHCLLIGGRSNHGGEAGLFVLNSHSGVGTSSDNVGSRLTYLPWAE